MENYTPYKIQLHDSRAFYIAFFKKRLLLSIPALLIGLPIALLIIIETELSSPQNLMHVILISAVAYLTYTLQLFIRIYYYAKKYYKSHLLPGSWSQFAISENCIIRKSKYGTIKNTWSSIYNAQESKHAIYLYISLLEVIIIPKSIITAQEYERLHTPLSSAAYTNKYAKLKRLK